MSGPAMTIALDIGDATALDDQENGGGSADATSHKEDARAKSASLNGTAKGDGRGGDSASFHVDMGVMMTKSKSKPTTWWLCALCKSVDVRELLGFIAWEALIVLIVVLAVANWIFFFKYVVEPEDPHVSLKFGTLWSMFTVSLLSFRSAVRAKCGDDVRALADHAEIFIAVSLAMVFSTNIAFYLHAPSDTPLRDLGFMLVPAQAVDSPWRPVSDVLTAVMPVVAMVQTYFMTRANRCRVISTFFRVATVSYALRMLTVSLTSLPGPAPHCRPGSGLYFPPQTWIDIVTRVGPMYGNFNSCGDLIFSGHMAYTNSALLLYLRTMDQHFVRFSKLRWTLGAVFLLTLATLCVSGRKHYSVDVMLGIMISTLVFFHFEHGWVPACVHHQPQRHGRRTIDTAWYVTSPYSSSKGKVKDLDLDYGGYGFEDGSAFSHNDSRDQLLFRFGKNQQ
uniref:Sphingomyelin synthase-like domain-containing protein n=1 Tax=Globisporangium ultimum (strain ATCC 200006 / CBS 805.95 / DAOM BR144) TaxID=431595 RepID=K3X811_GLOUD